MTMIPLDEIAAEQGLERQDVLELLQDFLEYTQSHDLVVLQDAVDRQALSEARKAAHSIKGAALNLRLEEIASLARQIEEGRDPVTGATLHALVDALRVRVQAVAGFLKSCRDSGQ